MGEALHEAYQGLTSLLDALADDEMGRASRCAGWTVADVVVHTLADAQRALVACATPTDEPATTDSAGYWRAWGGGDAAQAAREARFTRIHASAYRPAGLRAHWRDTSGAAVRALAARRPDERVRTQGHVLTVADLARTLVLEAVVHHLDCLLELPGRPGPRPAALAVVREDLSVLAGVPLPAGDNAGWALRAAGRVPLTDADRQVLGPAAERFPLLG